MNIDTIQILFSKIQEDLELFQITYGGFPIWCLVKNRLFNALLNVFIEKRPEKLYFNIYSKSEAILRQFVNVPISYFQWYRFNKFLQPNKPIALLLIDGFFRDKNDDFTYTYPFGEEIILTKTRKFDMFLIERNHRIKKKSRPLVKPNLREDFVSFSIPFSFFIKKNKVLETAKSDLLIILSKKLKDYPDILEILKKELYSALTDYLLYEFESKKIKALKVLNKLKPFALLLTAPVGLLWWVAAAKEMKIKVIEFQHGIIDKYQPQYNWPSKLSEQKKTLLTPDFIFMWGDYWVRENLSLGFWKENELLPCGSTKVDKAKITYSKMVENKISLNGSNIVKYLYTSCKPIRNDAKVFLTDFLSLISRSNSLVKILIKLHPNEDSEYYFYNELKRVYPDYCEIYYHRDKKLYDLFVETDVHLSVFSASVLESIEFGRPTAILNLPGKEYFENLIEIGAVKFADSPSCLLAMNNEIKNNSKYWKDWISDTKKKEGYFFTSGSLNSYVKYVNELSI